DSEGDILFLEKLLNEDPFQLPPMNLKLAEETKAQSSIEEPPELELKELSSHLEYAFLEDSNKLIVIIAKDLKDVEKEALIKYNSKSSNPTLVSNPSISESDFYKEPVVKSSSPTLTLFGESDFFLEEIEDFLNDDSIPTGIKNYVYDSEGDILFLEKLLNEDPFQLHPMNLKLAEETKAQSSIEEPPELELKELSSHLDIRKNLLRLFNYQYHTILMEDDYKPAVQSQRRVNPKIYDVIKKEVIKLLDAGYFQIPIDPQDQEKTTFTCPYGTFACPLACVMLPIHSKGA
nr:reverse transcriptase domain-containing protein [Tanacetum cinerariifolium]